MNFFRYYSQFCKNHSEAMETIFKNFFLKLISDFLSAKIKFNDEFRCRLLHNGQRSVKFKNVSVSGSRKNS